MDNELCTIDLASNMLDNEYTFYDDGRIKHFYDQSIYKPNQERWVTPQEISSGDREKILNKCPDKYKEKITQILTL